MKLTTRKPEIDEDSGFYKLDVKQAKFIQDVLVPKIREADGKFSIHVTEFASSEIGHLLLAEILKGIVVKGKYTNSQRLLLKRVRELYTNKEYPFDE